MPLPTFRDLKLPALSISLGAGSPVFKSVIGSALWFPVESTRNSLRHLPYNACPYPESWILKGRHHFRKLFLRYGTTFLISGNSGKGNLYWCMEEAVA